MFIHKESKQSRANCPPVHRFSVFYIHTLVSEGTLDKLWGGEFQRHYWSTVITQSKIPSFGNELCAPKIGDSTVAFGVDDDIFWLDIMMNDS